jgi:hypothetical protein
METTKQPLQVVIQSVIDANNPYAGTMYTKDDVIRILNTIEVVLDTPRLTDDQIEKLKRMVKKSVDNLDTDDVVNSDSVTFSIRNGNEIEVEDIDINYDTITDATDEAVEDFFFELNKQ